MNEFQHTAAKLLEVSAVLPKIRPEHTSSTSAVENLERKARILREEVEAALAVLRAEMRGGAESLLSQLDAYTQNQKTFGEYLENAVPAPSRHPELLPVFIAVRQWMENRYFAFIGVDKERWVEIAKELLVVREFVEQAFDGEYLSSGFLKEKYQLRYTVGATLEVFRRILKQHGFEYRRKFSEKNAVFRVERQTVTHR